MEIMALTDSEKVTMKCVWDIGDGARLAHVLAMAKEKYGKCWKSQTVSTFLGKLVAKGYLEQYREGRYCCYHILINQREYRCRNIADNIRFWEDGNISLFADILMDVKTLSAEQRDELRKAIG